MNRKLISCLILSSCMLLTACGGSASTEPSWREQVVLEIDGQADLAYDADSLQELWDLSDFVAEVKVIAVQSEVVEHTPLISTAFDVEVLTQYKGEFHGETLRTDGGYMNVGQYLEGIGQTQEHEGEFTEEELENGLVYLNCMETHIPENGETLLFFGRYAEEIEEIHAVCVGQSIYLCEDDRVTLNFSGDAEHFVSELQGYLQNTLDAEITQQESYRTAAFSKTVFIEAFPS